MSRVQDQLRLVSVSKGQDLKYALLRLQKAVARIEEALKVFSCGACAGACRLDIDRFAELIDIYIGMSR